MRRLRAEELPGLTGVDPSLIEDRRKWRVVNTLVGLGFSWVAERDERPIGYSVASRYFYDYPFIDLLVVAEAERRSGVGSALMARCESDHNADRIFTSTNESNVPMRALLAKAGWTPSGQIENLDPGDPELVYVKWTKG